MKVEFKEAKPIWIKSDNGEMNVRAIFRTVSDISEDSKLRIATSCVYSLFVNGEFVAYGPSRAGRDHFRMDIIDMSDFAGEKNCIITIEVQSYQVNSFCLIKQKPFLQAEIVLNSEVSVFTGKPCFDVGTDKSLVRKLQRFSFQRPFVEGYVLNEDSYKYRVDKTVSLDDEWVILPERQIIERGTQYPEYAFSKAENLFSGKAEIKSDPEYIDTRSYTGICDKLQGFLPEELEWHVSREVQGYKFIPEETFKNNLFSEEYSIYDFGVNLTGFLTADIEVIEDTVLYLLFDEVLKDLDVDITRDECCRAIKYILSKGKYQLKLFEPYSMKYAKVFVASGSCCVNSLGIIEYCHPKINSPFNSDDKDVNVLVDAAINTFRANAVDLFTDCPTRERGGYLCDSFFTARAEYFLTGSNLVEKDFLTNFLHEDNYDCIDHEIDRGIVPMCYPANHLDGVYIPNWGLWLILEIRDYYKRTGDRQLVHAFRDKIMGIINFHKALENSEHLLEKIPEGVFVEWSHANEMVQDINFPSNMLYSAALMAAYQLYDISEFCDNSKLVKQAVLKYSFVDGFFCDKAMCSNGEIVTVNESSEACQYYAFLFGIANKETHPELFDRLVNEFGPDRKSDNKYPDICFAAMFIGIPLRIQMLLENGLFDKAYEEIKKYYLKQAEETGTFWEILDGGSSYNHGFGAIVIVWLEQIFKHRKFGIC